MKYIFGVMSNKWELESESLDKAKLAMCLFIGKNIPIAIYHPKESAFMPLEHMKKMQKLDNSNVKGILKTIKEVSTNGNL